MPSALLQTDATAQPGLQPDTPLTLWLRAVLWSAVLVPAIAFAGLAWWGYQRARSAAEVDVAHASALALRQAERTLAVAAGLAARADAAAAAPDPVLREQEAAVHLRLADMVAGLPAVVNLNIWDAGGRPLAGSDLYPVDPQASVGDRAYFLEQRQAGRGLGISEVIVGRQTGRPLINATLRRGPVPSTDDSFRGVVAVSLSPSFFIDYYRSLANEQTNLVTFALLRTDGAVLARWPPSPDGRSRVPADNPTLQRVQAGEETGGLLLPASEAREERLISFRRAADYPIYVTAGISTAKLLGNWYRFVALIASVIVPVTAVLVYVTWVALKKTRREQAVSLALREEIGRRANTQKLETLAQLTGGVAHDFNNLLSIVSNSLHVHRRLHPELSHERQLEAMSRAIKSGVRLTRQLLSFSRKQALRPERVQLQDWLPATEDLIRSTLSAGVALSFEVAPDTRPVYVDLAELELALINTALNAQHAMPAGGNLRVRAGNAERSGAAMVVVSIADDGEGVPPALLGRIFEPFFTTKPLGKGSGLGLAQVQGLCAQAGGHVSVESEPGRGTTISLWFPAVEPVPVPAATDEAPATTSLRGCVLLVEDNEEVASATEILLKTVGLSVVRAASADAALAYLASGAAPPDVVLSDIAMPGSMNGIALAFALREQRPSLPVLLTTGYAEQLNDAVAGGFPVLTKPATPEEILAELRALIGQPVALRSRPANVR